MRIKQSVASLLLVILASIFFGSCSVIDTDLVGAWESTAFDSTVRYEFDAGGNLTLTAESVVTKYVYSASGGTLKYWRVGASQKNILEATYTLTTNTLVIEQGNTIISLTKVQ